MKNWLVRAFRCDLRSLAALRIALGALVLADLALRLPWLAPDITTAIVNGRQPRPLNAQTLMRTASRLPADWADQRALLGFQ